MKEEEEEEEEEEEKCLKYMCENKIAYQLCSNLAADYHQHAIVFAACIGQPFFPEVQCYIKCKCRS